MNKTDAPAVRQQENKQTPSSLDRYFGITENGSTMAREIRGGLVTFFAMAYILVLNPIILSGPDSTGAYLGGGAESNPAAIAAGTALIAGVMTVLMGVIGRYPLAIAAGLGLNSIVAGTIVQIPGMTWADGMGIFVIEGIVILLLVVTGLREAIFRAVPAFMRTSISVGLGLFITLVGLFNSGIIHTNGGMLGFGVNGSISTWPLVIFIVGLIATIVMMVRGVKGAILIGIIGTTIISVIVEAAFNVGPKTEENPGGWGLTVPALDGSPIAVPDFSTVGQVSVLGPIEKIGIVAVIVLAFSVLLADFFDTMGTMVAVGSEGKLLDENGNPPRTREILVIDSLGAIAGGLGGVSSNTAFLESATGVAEGARTGFASVVTGVMFLLATFLAPIFAMVPSEAAAPALVCVGFLMMQQVTEIEWADLSKAVPAFMTIAFTPFAYSITVGIGVGFITYVIVEAFTGKIRKIHPLMWVSAAMFVIYFLLDPIQKALGIG